MKKINRAIIFLIIYLIALAIYTFPRYQESGEWGQYIGVIIGSLAIFILLRYVLIRRMKFREQQKQEAKEFTKSTPKEKKSDKK